MMKSFIRVFAGLILLVNAGGPAWARVGQNVKETVPKPAVPIPPIGAILDAFRSHSLVALADIHGNQQVHAFRVSLIQNPRFAAAVNDIIVEFGNARYQDVMDRYVSGEDVPYEALRRVWQDTTQVEYEWDLPIYEEFFRAVRTVNASLPRERQLRVVLGDPPIDWDQVHSASDLAKWMAVGRDAHAVEVIQREVLARGHHALVIYGEQHLVRKNTVPGAPDEWARGLVAQLEKLGITKLFTIHPETRVDLTSSQPDIAAWPTPSLAILRGTTLGTASFMPAPARQVRMEDQFDAVLYLGPLSRMTMSHLAATLCSDRSYLEMRRSRLALVPPPPGAPVSLSDRLNDDCAQSPKGNAETVDAEPRVTEIVRRLIRDAAVGQVDAAGVAPDSRERLIAFLKQIGPQFLAPAGSLESLTLLSDTVDAGRGTRRYRAVFANGERVIWTVGLSSIGEITSLDPRPE